jgi:serine/threonine protein kinase
MTITKDPAETNPIMSEQLKREYRVVKRLGRGGMGDVYLAEQLRVGRRLVALKVLNRSCADNPEVVKRFEVEAATAGLIHHRNVVTIYESRVTDDGQIYVAMEYIAGQTLREFLAERKRLPLRQVVEITRQICAGLTAAHKCNIVHRDIKPDNIMLTEDEDGSKTVKLLDFGIARLSEAQSANITTQPGLIIGTPSYMSPEQARGSIGDRIDARSDIYSLAIVVYEMLTGRPLFVGESAMAILHHHVYDPPKPPSQICGAKSISPAVDRAILRALSKDRNDRPRHAADFAAELEAAYREIESSAGAATTRDPRTFRPTNDFAPQPTIPTVPPRALVPQPDHQPQNGEGGSGTRRVLWATLIVAILLGLAGWQLRKMNEERQRPAPSPTPTVAASPPVVVPVVLQDVLAYRIGLEHGDRERFLPDLTVRNGDAVSFQFRLMRPGALYLLEELKDGSWRWFNATQSDQPPRNPAGKWIALPRDQTYQFNDEVGEEQFRVIYVPEGLEWSLAETFAPLQLQISAEEKSKGTALIQPDAVRRAQAWLDASGVSLSAEGSRLQQPGAAPRVAHYRITLNHVAGK